MTARILGYLVPVATVVLLLAPEPAKAFKKGLKDVGSSIGSNKTNHPAKETGKQRGKTDRKSTRLNSSH